MNQTDDEHAPAPGVEIGDAIFEPNDVHGYRSTGQPLPDAGGVAELRRGDPPRRRGDQTVAVLGMTNAGKTTTTLAIPQAAALNDGGPRELACRSGIAFTELTAAGFDVLRRSNHRLAATPAPGEYTAHVTVSQRRRGLFWGMRERSGFLRVLEGPGGALLPAEAANPEDRNAVQRWQGEMLGKAREADVLVLCVDAARPLAHVLRSALAELLARLALPAEGRRPPTLRARRFLVLLTKIDVFTARVRASMQASDRVGVAQVGLCRLSSRAIAERLDPVQMAVELIGLPTLAALRQQLSRRAKLAVGLSSAWGFDPVTGEPLVDPAGATLALDHEPREPLVTRYTPYGVREALDFVVTGHAAGPVAVVRRDDLYVRLLEARGISPLPRHPADHPMEER